MVFQYSIGPLLLKNDPLFSGFFTLEAHIQKMEDQKFNISENHFPTIRGPYLQNRRPISADHFDLSQEKLVSKSGIVRVFLLFQTY